MRCGALFFVTWAIASTTAGAADASSAPIIISFTATPSEAREDDTVTAKWRVRNSSSTELLINEFLIGGGQGEEGEFISSLVRPGELRYKLRALADGQAPAEQELVVKVRETPRIPVPDPENAVVEITPHENAQGTGTVIVVRNSDTWIATAAHVVQDDWRKGRKHVRVRFYGETNSVDGEIRGPLDTTHDLALILVKATDVPAKVHAFRFYPVPLAHGSHIAIGQPVKRATGWERDELQKVSAVDAVSLQQSFVCTKAHIGYSGGPLLTEVMLPEAPKQTEFSVLVAIVTEIESKGQQCTGTATSSQALRTLFQLHDQFTAALLAWIEASENSFDLYATGTKNDVWIPVDQIPDRDWCSGSTGGGQALVGCVYRPQLDAAPEDQFDETISKVSDALGALRPGSKWRQDDSHRLKFDADGVRAVDFSRQGNGTTVSVELTRRSSVYQVGVTVRVAPK